jgi:hypothetical protein
MVALSFPGQLMFRGRFLFAMEVGQHAPEV